MIHAWYSTETGKRVQYEFNDHQALYECAVDLRNCPADIDLLHYWDGENTGAIFLKTMERV